MMTTHARPLDIALDSFDGPLSLLLYLIQKEEMRIDQLDLCKITQRYLDYLLAIQELNFDLASEYLFMASNLVWIKSRHIVSDDPLQSSGILEGQVPVIESEEDLIRRLKHLELFQSLGKKLGALQSLGVETFIRPRVDKKKLFTQSLAAIDRQQLINMMMEILKKDARKFAMVKRDRLSIKEKLIQLKSILLIGSKHLFDDLCRQTQVAHGSSNGATARVEKVITFISLLELARLSKVSLWQADHQHPIEVSVLTDLAAFDIETANGFEEEQQEAIHGESGINPPHHLNATAADGRELTVEG